MSTKQVIGITGATGQLGQLVIAALKERTDEKQLVALVRNTQKAAGLGIAAREANYDEPTTLTAAFTGIDTLLLISGNEMGKRAQQHKNVITAAQEAGVQRVVYTSLLHADSSSLDLAIEHLATEAVLKASGITYTILRNGWYTENYTGSIPGALAGGAFLGSADNGKISFAARKDYAEAAAVVLTTEGHDNKVYELAGDTAYTLTDLAAEITNQTKEQIVYKNLPAEAYAAQLKSFGLPEGLSQAIAGWDSGAAKGDLYDTGKVLSMLIGRPTTALSEVVKEALRNRN